MEALKFTAKTKKLELIKTEIPKIATSDSVLIKVAFSGICGTDLHIMQGEFPCNEERAFSLGHEFSGTVVEIGGNVTDLQLGDYVVVDPNNGCRCCKSCHSGQPHFCQKNSVNAIGRFQDGGWANYVVCPKEQIHKLPSSVTLEQGALAEPLSCFAHGWDLVNPINFGDKILVIGAGIIGKIWVSALHFQGHKHVTVSEPNLARLDSLKNLNTGYNLVTPNHLEKKQQNPDYVFDVIIDCSGYPPAIEQAISLLNTGGKLCMFGVAPPHAKIALSPFDMFIKELTIFGVNINPYTFPKALGILEAMGDRYLSYDNLGIKVFKFREYKEAIELLKKGAVAKAIFKI